MGELLLYIRCEAAKLRRKPLFAVLAASSVLLPLAFAFFLSDPPDSRTAVIQTMASLIQFSAYVVLIPAVAVLAANLLFEEQDNDTLKNLLCVPVSKARLAVAKLLMLLGFAVVFMAVGALVVLAVLWADSGGFGHHRAGLPAAGAGLRPAARRLPARGHSDLLPRVQHPVFQKRGAAVGLPVLGCADPGGV